MRLVTIKTGDAEAAAVMLPGGALPIAGINASQGTSWPTDLLTLLNNEDLRSFQSWFLGLGSAVEDLRGWMIPPDRVEYAPLYRRPRKIWGIGLNYAEHAEDLSESVPKGEPASFMRPDTTIIGLGD